MSKARPAKPPITAPAIVPDDGLEEEDKTLGLELMMVPDGAFVVWITSETPSEGLIEVEFEDDVGSVVLVLVPVAVRVFVVVPFVGEADVAGALVLAPLLVVIVTSASLPSNSTVSNRNRASLPVVTIFNVC
jgi:hypothetical protein